MKNNMLRALALACAWAAFQAAPAAAGFISMEVDAAAEVRAGALKSIVTLKNKGNEAAREVQVLLRGPGFEWASAQRSSLAPGASAPFEFRRSLKGLSSGRYPLFVTVYYADANGYPFTALAAVTFASGETGSPGALVIAERVELSGQGRLQVRLKNLEPREKTVKMSVHSPRELSVDSGVIERRLAPEEEARVEFAVRNFSALGGSSYPVFVAVEEPGPVHRAVIAQTLVRVAAAAPRAGRLGWLLAASALILALVAWLNFGKRR